MAKPFGFLPSTKRLYCGSEPFDMSPATLPHLSELEASEGAVCFVGLFSVFFLNWFVCLFVLLVFVGLFSVFFCWYLFCWFLWVCSQFFFVGI